MGTLRPGFAKKYIINLAYFFSPLIQLTLYHINSTFNSPVKEAL